MAQLALQRRELRFQRRHFLLSRGKLFTGLLHKVLRRFLHVLGIAEPFTA